MTRRRSCPECQAAIRNVNGKRAAPRASVPLDSTGQGVHDRVRVSLSPTRKIPKHMREDAGLRLPYIPDGPEVLQNKCRVHGDGRGIILQHLSYVPL